MWGERKEKKEKNKRLENFPKSFNELGVKLLESFVDLLVVKFI